MVQMSRIRQDSLYLIQGITVTFCVLLAVAVIIGGLFLLLMAIAPGRFSQILFEMAPPGIHWAVLMAAVMEVIYTYLLRLGNFVSARALRRISVMMGAIALLSLLLGILSLGR